MSRKEASIGASARSVPHAVQWLSDKGSIFAGHGTIEIDLALNLAPCLTPLESSDGMGEALVKTFERD
jgi:putative transposase